MLVKKNYILKDVIVDGIKMAQYCLKIKFGYHKIWGKDTGRNNAGNNKGTLLGIYPKITFTFRKLNDEDIGLLLSLFNKAENKVTFYHPDLKKELQDMSFYSNDQEFDQDYIGTVKGYSSAIISNRKREEYV